MSEITKIGLNRFEPKTQFERNKKEPSTENHSFEDQLMSTVNKLVELDRTVNEMIESTKPQKLERVNTKVNVFTKNMDTTVENISAASRASSTSIKQIASQYQTSQTIKKN